MKRYADWGMNLANDGDWIKYEDHAAILAVAKEAIENIEAAAIVGIDASPDLYIAFFRGIKEKAREALSKIEEMEK